MILTVLGWLLALGGLVALAAVVADGGRRLTDRIDRVADWLRSRRNRRTS